MKDKVFELIDVNDWCLSEDNLVGGVFPQGTLNKYLIRSKEGVLFLFGNNPRFFIGILD